MQWNGNARLAALTANSRCVGECDYQWKYPFDNNFCPSQLNVELLPSFFPSSVAGQLFDAGNCLAILRKAKHDHPLCRSQLSRRNDEENVDLGLLWSDDAMAQ